ncbi:MAG: ATP-dependent DNA ligase [Acidimicrobiales bacterium]
MDLPVVPPVAPMLAVLTREVPEGDWYYEPKWDGFRCIVFRSGDEVVLGSRNERPLTRYFPEMVEALKSRLPQRCVIDGELVIAGEHGLDFDLLSQRIHPAASRVNMLARTMPSDFIAFDLLALGHEDLRGATFSTRRAALEGALEDVTAPVHITPITRDPATARQWFVEFEGAGLDGVVAKPADLPYLEGKRVMRKIKHQRTAEFVVAGFRWYKADRSAVGSLLLGLYRGDELDHVGVIGAFPAEQRRQILEVLDPYRQPVDHPWAAWSDVGGGASRWNANKDLSFELLAPDLVVEATYEHLQGRRLRHTAQFVRWRPDRDPRSATFEQLDVAVPALLSEVLVARG